MKHYLYPVLILFFILVDSPVFGEVAKPVDLQGLREEAMELMDEEMMAEAAVVFERIRTEAVPGSIEAVEARFYMGSIQLVKDADDAGWGDGGIDERLKLLSDEALELRRLETEGGGERWLDVYLILGQIENRVRLVESCIDRLEAILGYWSGQTEVERARAAYMSVVKEWIDEVGVLGMEPYLENGIKIAKQLEDKVWTRVTLAQLLERKNAPEAIMRAGVLLEEAAEFEVGVVERAKVLELNGHWMRSFGRSTFDDRGTFIYQGDLEKALGYYKGILELKDEGGTIDLAKKRAERRVEEIEGAQLSLNVRYAFKPGREVQFPVTWKNVEAPTVRIYGVDYIESIRVFGQELSDWKLGDLPSVFEKKLGEKPEHAHEAVTELVRVDQELPAGSYLVEVETGGEKARSLLLVTGLSVVSFEAAEDRVVFVCESGKGIPLVNAEVWDVRSDRKTKKVATVTRYETDADGLVRLPRMEESDLVQEIVARSPSSGMSLSGGMYQWWRSFGNRFDQDDAVLHVMSERTLYRPGEVAHAALWLRLGSSGDWRNPDPDERYEYTVVNQGSAFILAKGELKFGAFGSAAIEVPVPADAALGGYVLTLKQKAEGKDSLNLETAFLWNVEAYRLPDFKGAIALSGGKGGYRTGDTIEGTVQVDYYAGGAVEAADVDLVVRRRVLGYGYWNWERGWSVESNGYWEEVEQFQLTTDTEGRAAFEIKTEESETTDFEYEVEARVRDLSRREVRFKEQFRVTEQPYSVALKTDRVLVKPTEPVILEVRTLDANEGPVSVEGRIRVTRERWRETYIHRKKGSEIEGEAYRALPERSLLNVAQSDYRLKESGFVTEEVEFEEVRTDEAGRYDYRFEPKETGYYTLTWIGDGERGVPIKNETSLWVSEKATQEMGYRPSGLEIIADRGPFAVGERVPYLLAAPTNGCFVLLVKNSGTVLDYSVEWIEGRTKMMELSVEPDCVPNVFLNAYTVVEERGLVDQHMFLVPPVEQYLDVRLIPDDDGYEPKDEATVRIETRDVAGNPVSAELAFAVTDEGIYSILEDRGEDIVETYYGEKHRNEVRFVSSMDRMAFFVPDETADGINDGAVRLEDFAVTVEDERGYGGRVGATDFREALSYSAGVPFELKRGSVGLDKEASVIALREDFKATAYWNPSIVTDEKGEAEVRFRLPDNLTEWRMTAVGATEDTKVGETQIQTTTRLPLIVRLQVPRFLTERDEVVFSGTYQNNTEHAVELETRLKVSQGVELEAKTETKRVVVDEGKVGRTEWTGKAVATGKVDVELRGEAGRFGDGVKRTVEVYPHGIEREVGLRGQTEDDGLELRMDLPEGMTKESLRVRLELLPNLGGMMMGALPFLIDYPYGCVEQTMSRFLPALAVKKALMGMGYDREALGALESAVGVPNRIGELDTIIGTGIKRIEEMQLEDGSWPWMSEGNSNPYMTAYVVWGLNLAEEYGVSMAGIDLEAARERLERLMVETEMSLADQCWLLHALASRYHAEGFGRPTRLEARTFLNLMNERDELRPVSLALLALSGKYFGFDQDAQLLVRQLANSVRTENGVLEGVLDGEGNAIHLSTTWWGKVNGAYFWADNAVETSAVVLNALLAVEPEHEWVESTVNWLIRNRTGSHWGNTRSTAMVVLALTDYLKGQVSGGEESSFEVFVNEVSGGKGDFGGEAAEGISVDLDRGLFDAGENLIRVKRKAGSGRYYFGLRGHYYAEDEGLAAVESDLRVEREYWHLNSIATLLDGWKEQLKELENGDEVGSGERVEVVIRLETKRNLKYVLLEDIKPAGFEAVQLLSGWGPRLKTVDKAGELGPRVYQELGDRKVAFMIEELPAGVWELRYRLRAEIPGVFHGMPAKAEAMYLDGVSGRSAEIILKVKEDES